jgi:hypothetical protein
MNNRKSRQEREFWDQRLGVEIATLMRTETRIRLSGDEKPRQWRDFLDSLRKTPKHRTGWWRRKGSNWLPTTQSFRTGSLLAHQTDLLP